MAKIKINSTTTSVSAYEANSTYVLAKGDTVDTQYTAISGLGTSEGTRFQFDGRITAGDGNGLEWGNEMWGGTAISVEIGKSGRITADKSAGLRLYGDDQTIDNAGRISGNLGVSVDGADSTIRNSGTIDGPGIAIHAKGDTTIVNSGSIASSKIAIDLNAEQADTGSVIRNSGHIEGNMAILGTALGERVTNTGTISGHIQLGGGDDTFIFKSGSTDHAVEGSFGDDRYIVKVKGAEIAEGVLEGFDFVKSSVSYALSDNIEQINLSGKTDINATGNSLGNHVQGNAGDNVLHGGGGTDYLLGLGGADRLFGDGGADTFGFILGTGHDTVMDFEIGIDELQLGGLKGAKDFDNMMDKHAVQKGDDVWITYGGDTVVLKNIDAGQLTSSDFTFA